MYVVRTKCCDECPAWKITVFISSKTKELGTYLNSLKHHRECPSHVTCSMGWPCTLSCLRRVLPPAILSPHCG